jgi:uncharacterized membrane protein
METHFRSLAKSMTWRLGGLVVTFIVAWAVTRRVELAASIGLADTFVKLLAYYLHERAWMKVRFGRAHPPEYDI